MRFEFEESQTFFVYLKRQFPLRNSEISLVFHENEGIFLEKVGEMADGHTKIITFLPKKLEIHLSVRNSLSDAFNLLAHEYCHCLQFEYGAWKGSYLPYDHPLEVKARHFASALVKRYNAVIESRRIRAEELRISLEELRVDTYRRMGIEVPKEADLESFV